MRILLIFLALALTGCSSIRPQSTILIYPINSEGIKKVEITQTRTGETEFTEDKDGNITFKYNSKGTSLIKDVSKEVLPILMLGAIAK